MCCTKIQSASPLQLRTDSEFQNSHKEISKMKYDFCEILKGTPSCCGLVHATSKLAQGFRPGFKLPVVIQHPVFQFRIQYGWLLSDFGIHPWKYSASESKTHIRLDPLNFTGNQPISSEIPPLFSKGTITGGGISGFEPNPRFSIEKGPKNISIFSPAAGSRWDNNKGGISEDMGWCGIFRHFECRVSFFWRSCSSHVPHLFCSSSPASFAVFSFRKNKCKPQIMKHRTVG